MRLEQKWSLSSLIRQIMTLVLLVSAVVVSGYALQEHSTTEAPPLAISHETVAATTELTEWVPELPVRLVIPAIKVDAPVQHVGLAPDGSGEMGVPDNFTAVAWYKDGVRPGMRGSAVITGHYNGKTTPQAVFYDLDDLVVGDEVVIMSAERIEDIFVVVHVATYDYDASTTDIFVSTDGKKRLNLITCSGDWLPAENVYDKRTVVFTELLTDVE